MNEFQHVRSGEPIAIPATAYNAMLDAAQAHRNRKINLSPKGAGFDSLYVHVENATGKRLERFSIVGLDGPSDSPDDPQNVDAFCNRITLRGIIPKEEHARRFAVLQQDAEPDMIVRACIAGVTVCKIQVSQQPESFDDLSCVATSGKTEYLKIGEEGAQVLWVESGTGTRWAIIRFGGTGGSPGVLFPVNLELASGTAGSSTAMCSFKYYVQHAISKEWWTDDGWGDEDDRIEVDPVEKPSRWRRWSLGRYIKADYGYARTVVEEDDTTEESDKIKLELGWINEVLDVKTCT